MKTAMIIMERIFIVLSAMGITFKILHYPGASPLFIIGLGALATLYFIMMHVPDKNESGETDVHSKDNMFIGIVVKVGGIALSVAVIGMLFKIQFYPGGEFMLLIGVIALIAMGGLALYKFSQSRSIHLRDMLVRFVIIGSLAATLYAIPNETLFTWSYPNNPEYVKAMINTLSDPENREFQIQENIEYAKMRGYEYDTLNNKIIYPWGDEQ